MNPLEVLKSVELFEGVSTTEMNDVARICQEKTFQAGDVITEQGKPGNELFIIFDGFVEVLRSGAQVDPSPRAIVNLGRGQIIGEMALVDRGPRSATVRALSEKTIVLTINREAFERLCDENHHLGYIVMRNIAADLSFKLRHRHLASR
jgi:CRP/FNR family cyclic AMP-dependent transcriptional regulator